MAPAAASTLAWRDRLVDAPVASTSGGARCNPSRRTRAPKVPVAPKAFYFRNTGGAGPSTGEGAASKAVRTVPSTNNAALPGLAFTSKPENIDPRRAAQLLGGSGDDDRLVRKLTSMFAAKEGCVIGAFARVGTDSSTEVDPNDPGGSTSNSPANLKGIWAMGFDMLAGEGNVDNKTLIGFAQAATDGAMVATVDCVVVDERYRRTGLGGKLVKRLGDELRYREIFDIGVRAPNEHQGFFEACNFGPDAEGAVLMSLPLTALGDEKIKCKSDASDAWIGSEVSLRVLGEAIEPGRTLKDGGEGLREMLRGERREREEDPARVPL
jgi:ribosomal protein S18 acetylase RimI-like enzyme